VDFDIEEGEFCAIVGTSGSGKSTLLYMLAGLEKPTRGSIRIWNQNIEKLNEEQLVKFRRDHVGFIFQSFHLLATYNAVENTALPLSFQGVSKSVRIKKAQKMLNLVNIGSHAKHLPTQLSGGQQQRVGIARALVANPKIVFADEPTGNLDSHTAHDMLQLMRNIVKMQKKTLIMVTHDAELASYADRVFHIKDGKITDIVVTGREDSYESEVPLQSVHEKDAEN
jgi:putative ABC transport system ATP-binding protein